MPRSASEPSTDHRTVAQPGKLYVVDGPIAVQVAGISYTYDSTAPVGKRILTCSIKKGSVLAPVNPCKSYGIIVNDFLAGRTRSVAVREDQAQPPCASVVLQRAERWHYLACRLHRVAVRPVQRPSPLSKLPASVDYYALDRCTICVRQNSTDKL